MSEEVLDGLAESQLLLDGRSISYKHLSYYTMNTHPSDHQFRDISSSEDRCKCPQCRDQLEMQLFCKKPLANIHLYRHLKKRQAPPVKQNYKEAIYRPKAANKQQSQNKMAATPVKYKPDRSKEANAGIIHMVSQSQRTKPSKEDQTRREDRLRPKMRSSYQGLRLAQISQNPETTKPVQRNAPSADRGRVEASPSCCNSIKVEQEKKIA